MPIRNVSPESDNWISSNPCFQLPRCKRDGLITGFLPFTWKAWTGFPDAWLWPHPNPATVGTWGVKQGIEALSLSGFLFLFVCLSHIKKKKVLITYNRIHINPENIMLHIFEKAKEKNVISDVIQFVRREIGDHKGCC